MWDLTTLDWILLEILCSFITVLISITSLFIVHHKKYGIDPPEKVAMTVFVMGIIFAIPLAALYVVGLFLAFIYFTFKYLIEGIKGIPFSIRYIRHFFIKQSEDNGSPPSSGIYR